MHVVVIVCVSHSLSSMPCPCQRVVVVVVVVVFPRLDVVLMYRYCHAGSVVFVFCCFYFITGIYLLTGQKWG